MFFLKSKGKRLTYSLLSRLYVTHIMAVISILCIIALAVYVKIHKAIDEMNYDNLDIRNLITNKVQLSRTELGAIESLLLSDIPNTDIKILSEIDAEILLYEFLDDRQNYENFYLLDSEGEIIITTDKEKNQNFQKFFKTKPWLSVAREQVVLSRVDVSDPQNPFLFVMRRITNNNVLISQVKLGYINEAINKTQSQKTNSFVINRDGKILFHKNKAFSSGKKNIFDIYDIDSEYLASDKYHFGKIFSENFDVYMIRYIDKTNLAVVTSYPLYSIFMDNILFFLVCFVLIFGAILKAFIDIKFMQIEFIRPIFAIKNIIKRMEKEGQINYHLDTSRIIELGEVMQGIVNIYNKLDAKRARYVEYEKKFGYIFEKSPLVILLIDSKTGDIVDVSDSAVNFYGYSKEELLRKNIFDLSETDSAQVSVIEYIGDGNVLSYELRQKMADGSIKEIVMKNDTIDINGEKFKFCIVEDATRRNASDRNLRKELERNIHSPIFNISWKNKLFEDITSASANVRNLLGYTPEEILDPDFDFKSIIHKDDLSNLIGEFNIKSKLFATNKAQQYESLRLCRLVRKNSSILHCNIFIKFISYDGKKIDEMIGYFIDYELLKKLQDQSLNNVFKSDGKDVSLSNTLFWEFDFSTNLFNIDKEFFNYLGYNHINNRAYLSLAKFARYVHKEDISAIRSMMEYIKRNGVENFNQEIRFRRSTGEAGWFKIVTVEVRKDTSDNIIYAKGIFEDTNYKRIADKYKKIISNIFAYSNQAIAIVGTNGKFIDVNDIFLGITGYEKNEVIGKPTNLLKSGVHDDVFYAEMWRSLIDNGFWRGNIWNKRKNGERYLEFLTISTVYDLQGNIEYFLAIFSDISGFDIKQRALKKIAYHDSLTGLPNKAMLEKELEKTMKNTKKTGKMLAVVYFDLDDFKPINDLYGHSVGDKFLILISKMLSSFLKESDVLARVGGDEFVAVVCDLDSKDQLENMLDNIMKELENDVYIDDRIIRPSISVGASLYPQNVEVSSHALIEQADREMYKCKLFGKNRYGICENDKAHSSYALVDRILNGLDDEEFSLVYQPIINIKTKSILAIESFIEWDIQDEVDLKDNFLKFISKYGVYENIVIWNIRQVLKDQLWLKEAYNMNLKISADATLELLYRDSFIQEFIKIAESDEYQNINMLEINIKGLDNSSAYDKDKSVLDNYTKYGVTFVLDDFGSSEKSLNVLKNINADTVKIADTLSLGVIGDAGNMIITRSSLLLCKIFSKNIVAKGIETSENMYFLIKAGYENLQGSFIANKMDITEIKKWFSGYELPEKFSDIEMFKDDDIVWLSLATMHRGWIRSLLDMLSSSRIRSFNVDEFAKEYTSIMISSYSKYINNVNRVAIHIEISDIIINILKGINDNQDVSGLILNLKTKRDKLLDFG